MALPSVDAGAGGRCRADPPPPPALPPSHSQPAAVFRYNAYVAKQTPKKRPSAIDIFAARPIDAKLLIGGAFFGAGWGGGGLCPGPAVWTDYAWASTFILGGISDVFVSAMSPSTRAV